MPGHCAICSCPGPRGEILLRLRALSVQPGCVSAHAIQAHGWLTALHVALLQSLSCRFATQRNRHAVAREQDLAAGLSERERSTGPRARRSQTRCLAEPTLTRLLGTSKTSLHVTGFRRPLHHCYSAATPCVPPVWPSARRVASGPFQQSCGSPPEHAGSQVFVVAESRQGHVHDRSATRPSGVLRAGSTSSRVRCDSPRAQRPLATEVWTKNLS